MNSMSSFLGKLLQKVKEKGDNQGLREKTAQCIVGIIKNDSEFIVRSSVQFLGKTVYLQGAYFQNENGFLMRIIADNTTEMQPLKTIGRMGILGDKTHFEYGGLDLDFTIQTLGLIHKKPGEAQGMIQTIKFVPEEPSRLKAKIQQALGTNGNEDFSVNDIHFIFGKHIEQFVKSEIAKCCQPSPVN